MLKSMRKKGMINSLVMIGYGLITFAVIIGVGLLVLTKLGTAVGAGPANDTITSVMGYLGSGSGGLVTWIPAIIALVIGIMLISAFGGGRNRKV